MNRSIAAALGLAIAFACGAASAAQNTPAKKPAAAKPAAKAKAPAEAPLPEATGEQTAAAAMTHFGDYACEFNQSVKVSMTPKHDGYVDVQFGKRTWTMRPVLSSTGALRLEDVKGQTLMLQIAHKSMLMDVKVGQRLVDECQHEKQLEAKRAYQQQQAQAGGSGGGLLQADNPSR